MSKYIPLNSNDVVCVGLSGGKDSITLLYNLLLRYKKIKSPNLIAITVDEGISTVYKQNQEKIKEFFRSHDVEVPLIQVSFKDFFGLSMDEIVKIILSEKMKLNACTVCASIRRRIINVLGKENGATKIAIGHNLDDLAQSFLMNTLRNDLEKIVNTEPYASRTVDTLSFLPRIKPLFLFTEEEIIQYCKAKNLPYFSHTCQYALDFPILRKKVQNFINSLDERSFELKYNIIQFHMKLNSVIDPASVARDTYNHCKSCSYPTGPTRIYCSFCEFKDKFTKFPHSSRSVE